MGLMNRLKLVLLPLTRVRAYLPTISNLAILLLPLSSIMPALTKQPVKIEIFFGEETDRIENFAPALLTELQGAVDQFCSPYYYWRWRYAPINCKPASSFSGLTKNNSINGQSYHHNPLFGLQRSWWGYTTGEEFDHLSWPILSFLSGRTIRILLVKSPMEVLSGWSGGEDAPPGSLNVIGLILEGGLSNSHKWSNQSYESFHT